MIRKRGQKDQFELSKIDFIKQVEEEIKDKVIW